MPLASALIPENEYIYQNWKDNYFSVTYFFGPLTKHQSTPMVWPKMSEPSSASRAALASS